MNNKVILFSELNNEEANRLCAWRLANGWDLFSATYHSHSWALVFVFVRDTKAK